MESTVVCGCVCVCVEGVEASIFRGLKCGCKTLMIPYLLTKQPRYHPLLTHFPHINHSELHIVQSTVKEETT